MKIFISSLLLLASGGSNSVTTAFTTTPTTSANPSDTSLSSSRYNNDYYRDYSNNNSYRNNNYNNNNNGRYDNYVMDRNAGRFDNSVGSATYGSTSIGGRRYDNNNRSYGGSSYYNSNDSYYRGPYDRVGSSENFRLTSSPNSRKMRSDYYYDDYDNNNYYNNNNNYVTQRRGGYADDIGGRSRYSTPMYSNGGYASPQGLSEDFRTGREGPMMNSMTSRQRRNRNSNRIQDYYTPGEREWMSQRQNSGLRYGWQQQYDRERGNVRMGSGEDFRRGSSLSRISDYFTPLERERRQMSDNRVLGRGGGGVMGMMGIIHSMGVVVEVVV